MASFLWVTLSGVGRRLRRARVKEKKEELREKAHKKIDTEGGKNVLESKEKKENIYETN